ncbi:MAG: phosphotransferase family protein [Acidimicrobiales bacterium]
MTGPGARPAEDGGATDPAGSGVEATARPQTSTRDRDDLHRRLVTWLGARVTDPEVSELVVPESNGMSSETLLFECTWRDTDAPSPAARITQACAARLVPDPDAVPVFPVYDLERQFRVLRLVAERTRVPVPRTLWLELDPEAIGSPFFVMERVEGVVPPDIMPYPFGSWLSEAPRADQDRLQDSSVRVLAELHGAPVSAHDIAFLELDRPGDTALRRHLAEQRSYYEWVVADGARSPLIERTFTWLEDHWPASEGAPVISWGDARIGNMMFRDFEPVAVLDWEMAAVGPREIDIGWMVYLHRFLDDIAIQAGLPGMPHFMRLDDVAAAYARHSGHTPTDLDFYTMYAALRHAIVMSRVARRQVLFGEITMPEDPDDMIMHRPTLEQMLAGTYWDKL